MVGGCDRKSLDVGLRPTQDQLFQMVCHLEVCILTSKCFYFFDVTTYWFPVNYYLCCSEIILSFPAFSLRHEMKSKKLASIPNDLKESRWHWLEIFAMHWCHDNILNFFIAAARVGLESLQLLLEYPILSHFLQCMFLWDILSFLFFCEYAERKCKEFSVKSYIHYAIVAYLSLFSFTIAWTLLKRRWWFSLPLLFRCTRIFSYISFFLLS